MGEVSDAAPRSGRVSWWRVAGPGLAIGVISGAVGIGRRSLWLDEAYTLGALHQLPLTLRETNGTMGLYYVLLKVWTVPSEATWWLRSLSLVFALGALAATVALARRLTDDLTATLVGVLFGLWPMVAVYSQEGRSYALVMLLVAASWLSLDQAMAPGGIGRVGDREVTPSPGDRASRSDDEAGVIVSAPGPIYRPGTSTVRWWWLHTVLVVIMPLTHGLALLAVLAQVPVVAVATPGWKSLARAVRGPVVGLAVTAVLLSGGANSVGDWVDPLSVEQVEAGAGRMLMGSGWALVLGSVLVIAAMALAVVRVAGPGRGWGWERARHLIPVAWGAGSVMLLLGLSTVRPSFIARYGIGAVPGVVLLVAVVIRSAWGWRRPVAVALLVAVLIASAGQRLDLDRARGHGWDDAARLVAAGFRPGDVLLLGVATTRPPFEAAWREVDDAPAVELVEGDRPLGRVLRFEDDPPSSDERWRSVRERPERVWLVGDLRRLELDRVTWLVGPWPDHQATHREMGRWVFGTSVTVVLLEPRR